MKLYVWEQDSGEVRIVQNGGVSDDVCHRYGKQGKTARPFKEHPFRGENLPIGKMFFNGQKITRRPALKAKLEKTTVRVGDVAKIKGVPAGAYLVIADGLNSERYGPTDGKVIHMTMEDRGRRQIMIDAFPHLHQTLHLNVE